MEDYHNATILMIINLPKTVQWLATGHGLDPFVTFANARDHIKVHADIWQGITDKQTQCHSLAECNHYGINSIPPSCRINRSTFSSRCHPMMASAPNIPSNPPSIPASRKPTVSCMRGPMISPFSSISW